MWPPTRPQPPWHMWPPPPYFHIHIQLCASSGPPLCNTNFCTTCSPRTSNKTHTSYTSIERDINLTPNHLWCPSSLHGGLRCCFDDCNIKLPFKMTNEFTHVCIRRYHCVFLWVSDKIILAIHVYFSSKVTLHNLYRFSCRKYCLRILGRHIIFKVVSLRIIMYQTYINQLVHVVGLLSHN